MDFEEKLRQLVVAKHGKVADFAEKIDVNYTQVSQYLNGRKVSIEFLNKVIEEFPDVDLNWLLKNSATSETILNEPTTGYKKEKNSHDLVNEITDLLEQLKSKLPL